MWTKDWCWAELFGLINTLDPEQEHLAHDIKVFLVGSFKRGTILFYCNVSIIKFKATTTYHKQETVTTRDDLSFPPENSWWYIGSRIPQTTLYNLLHISQYRAGNTWLEIWVASYQYIINRWCTICACFLTNVFFISNETAAIEMKLLAAAIRCRTKRDWRERNAFCI